MSPLTIEDYPGLLEIVWERVKQVTIKDRSVEDDVKYNTQGELIRGAMYILQLETEWPETWNDEYRQKVDTYDNKKRLVVAGALIAAELDRVIYLENKKE